MNQRLTRLILILGVYFIIAMAPSTSTMARTICPPLLTQSIICNCMVLNYNTTTADAGVTIQVFTPGPSGQPATTCGPMEVPPTATRGCKTTTKENVCGCLVTGEAAQTATSLTSELTGEQVGCQRL